MFKHRLSKFGKASLFAMCMLFVGGSLQSCQDMLDDYPYDDSGDPEWLGASVYDFLKKGTAEHTYNNFVAIIDSLGETETLAHTGSKTLFVADDAAFEKFFENNPWGVKSVGDMTKAQMKMILYSAMLDNAMLLDMLSSSGTGTGNEGSCMRRETSASVIDTIPLVEGAEMPTYNKYWDALRGKERNEKLRIAKDGTRPMMVHFLYDYLKNNAIEAEDIEFLFTKNGTLTNTYTDDEVLVFDKKIVSSGVDASSISDDTLTITCKNGYIYRLDGVLLPPSNMAEELRNHKDTKVFSHLLDRFCIPVYDASLTADYQSIYKTNDSIFRLRYFTKDFTTYSGFASTASNPVQGELLNYDPGWNAYANSLSKERDMAAMFVPNDEVMYQYFADENGAGNFLLKHFAPNVQVKDIPTLLEALDSVPETNIVPFLNNLMKATFSGTVLSKFDKITDDANDVMGIEKHHVDECVIANNGVIYILNNVFGPAEFQSVSAPTLVFENMLIMRRAISDFDYNYYLLAMQAEYSFIVPDDKYFVYYDPATFTTDEPKVYSFHYNADRPKGNGKVELWADVYEFDPRTYEIVDTLTPKKYFEATASKDVAKASSSASIFKDLMEYLIIVDNVESGNKYYQTKGYGTIKVDASNPDVVKFYGGEQIEAGLEIVSAKEYNQKNGVTYSTVPVENENTKRILSSIPTPPTKSVYDNLEANAREEGDLFYEFFNLCNHPEFLNVMQTLFAKTNGRVDKDSLELYSIFYTPTNTAGIADGTAKNIVPFFNVFHYTVYAPSNSSIQAMYDRGLPTWEEINEIAADEPLKAASLVRLMNRFIRYHFQDNSVYVDNNAFSIPSPEGAPYTEANFASCVINDKTGRFYETVVRSTPDNSTIMVKDHVTEYDDTENWARIQKPGEEGKTWNIMCRDITFKAVANKPSSIESSSFAVIQPIDRVLLTDAVFGYDKRVCRYASTGELVDTMTVAGGANGAVDGKYLVADYGNITMTDLSGVERVMRAGYLMTPLSESDENWNSSLTREALVLKGEEKMLVNSEGMLIQVVLDADDNATYEYVVEDGNMLKVDNAGNTIERIPVTAGDNN